jgi:hypothetical protein
VAASQGPSEAVTLARVVIDKYGAESDKPSVKLAIALVDGAHERDALRDQLATVERERNERCAADSLAAFHDGQRDEAERIAAWLEYHPGVDSGIAAAVRAHAHRNEGGGRE